jgi:tetratricopeptide (TPR) repeat protein
MADGEKSAAGARTYNLSDLKIEPIYAGSFTQNLSAGAMGSLDKEISAFNDSIKIDFGAVMDRKYVPPPLKRPKQPLSDMKRLCIECGAYLDDLAEGNNLCEWHKSLREKERHSVARQVLWSRPSLDESTVLPEAAEAAMLDMRPQDEQSAAERLPAPSRQAILGSFGKIAPTGGPSPPKAASGLPDDAGASMRPGASSDDRASEAAKNGLKFFEEKSWDKAVFALNDAIRADSDRPRLYYMRAVAYYRMSDLKAAQADFVKALNLDPNYAKANRDYGRLLMKKGYVDAAERYISRSLQIEPGIRRSQEYLDKLKAAKR